MFDKVRNLYRAWIRARLRAVNTRLKQLEAQYVIWKGCQWSPWIADDFYQYNRFPLEEKRRRFAYQLGLSAEEAALV